MTFDDDLQRAFALLADRLRDEISRELKTTAAVLAGSAVRDRERVAVETRDAVAAEAKAVDRTGSSAFADLFDHVSKIDRASSLTETLDALAAAASQHAPRVAILLAQGPQLRGWKFAGFADAVLDPASVSMNRADAGLVAEAAEAGHSISARGAHAQWPSFAGTRTGGWAFACPLVVGGQTVAVLYADGEQDSDPSALEILCRFTARKLEAVAAFKTARHLSRPSADPREGTAASGEPDGAGPRPARSPQIDGDPQSEEDAAARRYARLLLSEIKLYHEKDVVEGCRERDLMLRLGGEIARARGMYEERVPPPVRRRADHFQAELVETLADGDATLVESNPVR